MITVQDLEIYQELESLLTFIKRRSKDIPKWITEFEKCWVKMKPYFSKATDVTWRKIAQRERRFSNLHMPTGCYD